MRMILKTRLKLKHKNPWLFDMISMNDFSFFFNRLKTTLKSVVLKGRIVFSEERADIQTSQVETFTDDIKTNVENFQNYGLKSFPPENSECVLLNIGASSENPIIFGAQHRPTLGDLPTLVEGDCVLYNNSVPGSRIHLKGNNIELNMHGIKFDNGSEELIAVLVELVDTLINVGVQTTGTGIVNVPMATSVTTAMGTLNPTSLNNLNAIKLKLEGFEV